MSDQDFFFDEDEKPKAEAKKSPAAKSAKSSSKASAPAPAAQAAQSVSMTVASLIGVIALLAGVIVGILLPIGGGSAPAAVPATTTSTGMGQSGSAPQLSEEQLSGGELPAGHPDISSMGASGTAESTATGE